MSQSKISYRAVLDYGDDTVGNVHGNIVEAKNDIIAKLICHMDSYAGYLGVKLNLSAPLPMHCRDNKYLISIKLYSNSISSCGIEKVTPDNIDHVPAHVRKTHRFKETATSGEGEKPAPGVYKLTFNYDPADAVPEGLYNNLVFENYVDPESGVSEGDKPHIQRALITFRKAFKDNTQITFYVRNENLDFQEEMKNLIQAMDTEKKDGPTVNQFYNENQIFGNEETGRLPFLQIGQQKDILDRPKISTTKTYAHRNFTDQSMEFEKEELAKFNETRATMKFLTIPGRGKAEYLGVIYINATVSKRLQVNDVIWVSFASKYTTMITTEQWKAQVIDTLPWMKSGEVAVVVSRPRQAHPQGTTDEEKKVLRDYILGKLPAGNGEVETDEQLRAEIDKQLPIMEVKQSLAWTILVVAGDLVFAKNAYTDPSKWANFRMLFLKFSAEGEYMAADEMESFNEALKAIKEYCVSVASVLVSTENNLANDLYVNNFGPVWMVVIDEANRSLITDSIIPIAHMEPDKFILVGDTKQLKPVVVGPMPLTGFLRELEVSTMSYFLEAGWPAASIYIQRRSRAGIMDIPVKRFYHSEVTNTSQATSDILFHHTKKVMDIIGIIFRKQIAQKHPAMYFEVIGSKAATDPNTKSKYNLQIAAVVMNIIGVFVENGIPPKDQGIVTPYMSQMHVYKYAANQLHLQYPEQGYDKLLIGTADSMEGEERPVIHVDTVVTAEIGFVDDPGRMLVMMTRAKHANLVYGNTVGLSTRKRESELVWFFDTAKSPTRLLCRQVKRNSKLQKHPYIQNRTIRGGSSVE